MSNAIETDAAPQSAPSDPHVSASAPIRKRKRRGGGFAKWRARFFVLVLIAGAVYGGLWVAAQKTTAAAQLSVPSAILTAQPVAVQALVSGQVTQVKVTAGAHVSAGQNLGSILTTTVAPATGKVAHKTVQLTAPTSGVVSDAPLPLGSTLQAASPFVVIYDPMLLTFVANVPATELPRLAAGMTATLRATGVTRPVAATVQRVVPRVGSTDPSVPVGQMQLILVPKVPAQVAGLLPGLNFTASVDTSSVSGVGTRTGSLVSG